MDKNTLIFSQILLYLHKRRIFSFFVEKTSRLLLKKWSEFKVEAPFIYLRQQDWHLRRRHLFECRFLRGLAAIRAVNVYGTIIVLTLVYIHKCWCTVTCKVLYWITSMLLNQPQGKVGQSCANRFEDIIKYKQLIPTSCLLLAIRLCSSR